MTTFQVVNGTRACRWTAGEGAAQSGSPTACGVKFEAGQTYTVSTYREEIGTSLFANLCSIAVFSRRQVRSCCGALAHRHLLRDPV